MTYMIFDITGNALGSFENLDAARATLRRWVDADPSAMRELMIVSYDGAGEPVGEPETVADLTPQPAYDVAVTSKLFSWSSRGTGTFVGAPLRVAPVPLPLA